MHGGEAEESPTQIPRLPVETQRAIQVFLLSLTRPTLPEVSPMKRAILCRTFCFGAWPAWLSSRRWLSRLSQPKT